MIFINGCFWHGHNGCNKFVMPKSNTEFWESKIFGNKERDLKNYRLLKNSGWKVIVIWECQLGTDEVEETMTGVMRQILNYATKRHVAFAAEPYKK